MKCMCGTNGEDEDENEAVSFETILYLPSCRPPLQNNNGKKENKNWLHTVTMFQRMEIDKKWFSLQNSERQNSEAEETKIHSIQLLASLPAYCRCLTKNAVEKLAMGYGTGKVQQWKVEPEHVNCELRTTSYTIHRLCAYLLRLNKTSFH